jgi:divalent metal cation (Fe/Co/Zn/Cd) transporter
VAEADRICDELEAEIEGELRNTDVTIHVEPKAPPRK